MERFSIRKGLFTVLAVAVMTLSFTTYAFAWTDYKATKEDIEAVDISDVSVSSEGDDPVDAYSLNVNDMDVREALFYFHKVDCRKLKLYRMFDLSGVDDSKGSKINIVNGGIKQSIDIMVYQYNSENNSWRYISSMVYDGRLRFTTKKEGYVALVLSQNAKVPARVNPAQYTIKEADLNAFDMTNSKASDEDSYVVSKKINPNKAKSKTMVYRFHSQVKKRDLYRIFDVSGMDDSGTKVKLIDYGINTSQDFNVYQYDYDSQIWKIVQFSLKAGKIQFTLKSDGPIAVTLPAGTTPKTGIYITSTKKSKWYNGQHAYLTANVYPKSKAATSTVKWSTTNSKVITLNKKTGNKIKVTAVGAGTATVKAKIGTKVYDKYTIYVNPTPVSSVKFAKKTININKGNKQTLKWTISPKNATNQGVTFESSDPGIVSVNKKGKITANSKGRAIITVRSKENYFKKATCTVKVI